ncbi:glycosyltransferase [Adhaeribacter aquaticus]|uniref:glycosyltransferase n=1 Tax=Adhaeribacter aquaticus TaxID=299567 RepID=UPI0004019971|nr:glycosyltransferase [Adhaeribacter aquaticus]
MNNILVSIIIPTYNRLEYFKKALHSALNQTYRNIEVIVTDDSSINDIEEYVKTIPDNRIKYFRNKKQLGIALNTQNGILKSQGQYFSFLNDDDFWCENFLEKLVAQLHTFNDVACAFSDHWLVDENDSVLTEQSHANSILYKRNELKTGLVPAERRQDLFLTFTVPVAMACLLRRDSIDINNYPVEVGGAYDRWLLLQIVSNENSKFLYVDEKLTNYRVHSQSVSATQVVKVSSAVIYILEQSLKLLKLNKKQKKDVQREIRIYIRSLVKQKSTASLKYIPLYLETLI